MKYLVLLLFVIPHAHASLKAEYEKFVASSKQKLLAGGGMDGGGNGGMRVEEGAAWFYLNKPSGYIRTCYHIGKKFKATEDEVKEAILTAFSTWEKYFQKIDLYQPDLDANGNPIPYPEYLKIATKIKFESCQNDTELTFYFGEQDQRVKDVLDGMPNAKGFAFRKYQDIDSVNGTSKGIVWIFDPQLSSEPMDDHIYNWGKVELLQAMVNHEVGHVMGAHHQDRTIMQEDLKSLFEISQFPISSDTTESLKHYIQLNRKYLKTIDHFSRLVYSIDDVDLKGKLGIAGSLEEKNNFKYFMGRDSKGKISVEAKLKTESDQFIYKIMDEQGSKTWVSKKMEFKITSIKSSATGNNQLKRVRKICKEEAGTCSYEKDESISFGATAIGSIEFGSNIKHEVMIDIGPSFLGYYKTGEIQNSISSFSNFALHYFDKNHIPHIMFVEDIVDFSSINEQGSRRNLVPPVEY